MQNDVENSLKLTYRKKSVVNIYAQCYFDVCSHLPDVDVGF